MCGHFVTAHTLNSSKLTIPCPFLLKTGEGEQILAFFGGERRQKGTKKGSFALDPLRVPEGAGGGG